jgi:hypothetical protein
VLRCMNQTYGGSALWTIANTSPSDFTQVVILCIVGQTRLQIPITHPRTEEYYSHNNNMQSLVYIIGAAYHTVLCLQISFLWEMLFGKYVIILIGLWCCHHHGDLE